MLTLGEYSPSVTSIVPNLMAVTRQIPMAAYNVGLITRELATVGSGRPAADHVHQTVAAGEKIPVPFQNA